jgi:hypothetical protein
MIKMAKKEKEPETPATDGLKELLEGLSNTGADGNEEYVPTTDIELTHEVVGQLFDDNNIKMISDLNEKQITGILKLQSVNHILYGDKQSTLSMLVDNFLTLQVSKHRQGRGELIRAIANTEAGDEGIGGRFKRFLG